MSGPLRRLCQGSVIVVSQDNLVVSSSARCESGLGQYGTIFMRRFHAGSIHDLTSEQANLLKVSSL